MSETYGEKSGYPFTGNDRKRLIHFLKNQELEYDENITYSYVLEDGEKIIATGSCHGNVLKCIAVAPEYQGRNLLSVVMTHLTAYMFEQGISHYFGFTKPKNRQMFCNMGLYPVAETKDVLLLENKKNGLKKYLGVLQKETGKWIAENQENENGEGIGAIVANCNPFTSGHRYLIEQAAVACKWLHLFILSEEQGDFTATERFDMVRTGVSDIPNVILHRTSDYLISPVVFPTYFIKEKERAYTINCMLDIEIFRGHIAKELGISRRFIGSEPECAVTRQYNECLKKELPECGIEVQELKRYEASGQVVSASKVRKAWKEGKLGEVEAMLPETTRRHLLAEHAVSREVTLMEMLDARESRVHRQQEYIKNSQSALISFMLNIPGPVKVSTEYYRVFEEGIHRICRKLRQERLPFVEKRREYPLTGYEYYANVFCDARELKRLMTEIEEADTLGRLFDIDVLDRDGKKISRDEIGKLPRKCLLCEKEAHICARSRAHSVEEMLQYIRLEVERYVSGRD